MKKSTYLEHITIIFKAELILNFKLQNSFKLFWLSRKYIFLIACEYVNKLHILSGSN